MQKIPLTLAFAFLAFTPISIFAESDKEIQILAPWSEKQETTKVSIINKARLSEDNIAIIKKVIESDKYFSENGMAYFEGWAGALNSSDSTKRKFEISVSDKLIRGDIVIELVNEVHPQYTGYTVPHYADNHIISASIQIYDASNMQSEQLENLMRHELGHAFGLGHTSLESDIMYESMGMTPKFISACDIAGLKALLEGQTFSSMNCS